MALLACVAISFGRSSRVSKVTALSFATISTNSRNVAGRSFTKPSFFNRHFESLSSLKSATATIPSSSLEKLEKSLDVTHPAFETICKDVVTEYGAYCTLYRHKKSGAELLSVASDDDNKVFGITFRTPPEDSTGVPHILEHSVLCGSRKYKTKDPFVQLLQGSLQTFLNAFTYPDRTCYVVASQNEKDFYNLVNVYSDAVYHPRAVTDPNVHAQEGWHLELENKAEPLTYKGVVYNEMKGVYSSPDSLLYRQSQQSIFPDNTYGVDSGGDPIVIPDLSFEQFADFHKKFYHPANSRIYFSGDDDVATRLELMDEYLSEFDASPESKPGSVIEWQKKKYTEPQHLKYPYPIGGDQPETHMVMVNWLMNDAQLAPVEEMTIQILDHLLMGTTQSVLRKAVMESGLGAAVVGGGVSDELLQATFSVGLKGVEKDNVKEVEQLILDTLQKVVDEGFTDDAIDSSMNTMEFDMREFNTGSFPKGLSFMLGAMSKWLYDESPTSALKFEEPLAELKAKIEESGSKVFQDMVEDMLIKNTHRTTVEMVPSKTLEEETLNEEKERLAAIKKSLDDDKLDEIVASTKKLKELQASEDPPEARATIPSLSLEDLKREVTEYPIEVTENEADSSVTVVRHELVSTSGIAYADLGVDLSNIPLEDVPLLSIFTRMMTENGAGDLSDIELSRKIGTYTGGVNVLLSLTGLKGDDAPENAVSDGSLMMTKLFIRGKATRDRTEDLFSIYKLILTEARLDSQSKVLEILKESKARLEAGIQGSGHQYSQSRMKARYNPASYIAEKMSGISYLATLKELEEMAKNDWPSLLARLEGIRKSLLDQNTCRDGMIINLTGDKEVLDTIQPSVDAFLKELPGDSSGAKLPDFYKESHPWIVAAKEEMAKKTPLEDEGFVVSSQVSYVGKAGRLYEPNEVVPGAANVVAKFLRTGYLWDHVRVIGGAYGGFCTFSADDGIFSFLSYRDPNLASTIDVYDNAADNLLESSEILANDPEALATAIIGTIGDMDSALSPDQKGWLSLTQWIKRETSEARQRLRDEVLNCKAEDFKAFGERLKQMKETSVAVVSSKGAFEEAAKAGKEMKLTEIV